MKLSKYLIQKIASYVYIGDYLEHTEFWSEMIRYKNKETEIDLFRPFLDQRIFDFIKTLTPIRPLNFSLDHRDLYSESITDRIVIQVNFEYRNIQFIYNMICRNPYLRYYQPDTNYPNPILCNVLNKIYGSKLELGTKLDHKFNKLYNLILASRIQFKDCHLCQSKFPEDYFKFHVCFRKKILSS